MSRLQGRNALVTGGASGLGRAIAARLRREGARVFITDIDHDTGISTAAEDGFTFLLHDVTNEGDWTRVMQSVAADGGQLDVLVNNTGILGPTDDASPENSQLADFQRVLAVNAGSVFLGCRAAITRMSGFGGAIINISSIAGLQATPYATAYGASKAAVLHLTKSVAQHCAERGLRIRCNVVLPGVVRTGLWETYAKASATRRDVDVETIEREAKRRSPLGELCTPDDVAAAVTFLATDDALHITGTALIVDSGVTGCDTFRFRSVE